MDKNLGFEGQKRLKNHRQRHNRWLQHHPRLGMAPRWAGVMLGPMGAPLAVIIKAFLALKTQFFVHLGRGTAQKRLE
jgi:hypothetical protein